MLNIQLQELKNSSSFKGSDLIARSFFDPDNPYSYTLFFTCKDSQNDYLLMTQTNKVRRFKSIDTIITIIKDLQCFNDLNISSLRIEL